MNREVVHDILKVCPFWNFIDCLDQRVYMESISCSYTNQNALHSLTCAVTKNISVLFRPRNPFDIICCVFINLVNFSSPEHHFMKLQLFYPLDQLPSNEITGKTPIIAYEKRRVGISHCPVLISDTCHTHSKLNCHNSLTACYMVFSTFK